MSPQLLQCQIVFLSNEVCHVDTTTDAHFGKKLVMVWHITLRVCADMGSIKRWVITGVVSKNLAQIVMYPRTVNRKPVRACAYTRSRQP